MYLLHSGARNVRWAPCTGRPPARGGLILYGREARSGLGRIGVMGKALTAQLVGAGCTVTLISGVTDDGFGEHPLILGCAHRDDRGAFEPHLTQGEFVVRLQCVHSTHVADAVHVLAGHVRHYIFISTNSVVSER